MIEDVKTRKTLFEYFLIPKNYLFKETHEETEADFVKSECHICGKFFGPAKVQKIDEHIALIHEGIKNQCEFCDGLFAGEDSLRRHVRVVHTKTHTIYKCEDCGLECTSSGNLRLHQRGSRNQRTSCKQKIQGFQHPCKICQKFYPNEASLKRHVEREHPDGKESDIGNKNYKTCQELRIRKNRVYKPEKIDKDGENGEYHCSKCPRVFLVMETLEQHIAAAHADKSFQCEVCKLTFTKLAKLQKHAKNSHADFEFNWSIDHITRIQVDAIEISKCKYCGKRFLSDQRLKDHKCIGETVNWENVHKNLEYQLSKSGQHGQFECLVCNKSFVTKTGLSDHVGDMHSILNLQHIDPNVPQTLYKCEPCNLTYKTELSFRQHVTRSHPDVEESSIIQM